MNIIFFDTETTGNGAKDRLCQLAIKERGVDEPLLNATYKPPLPISLIAMSIHHITEKMLEGRPSFSLAEEYPAIKDLFEHHETVAVAHNASFDIGMLAREGVKPRNVICTYKVARAIDSAEEFEQYKLQYLRYFFGIDIDANAHDAFGDVLVLEGVFEHLLGRLIEQTGSEEAALAHMLAISNRPMLFTTLRFGKYNGKRLEDIARADRRYLEWLLREKKKDAEGEGDWIFSLEHYLSPKDPDLEEAIPF